MAATTSTRKSARSAKTTEIRYDLRAPEPCQAGQIAFAMMRRAKVSTWKQLLERLDDAPEVAASVWLTDTQQGIIDRHLHLLPMLSVSDSTVTIIACEGCGAYGLHDKRPVPSGCYFTLGCTGKLHRAALTEASAPKPTETEAAEVPAQDPPTPESAKSAPGSAPAHDAAWVAAEQLSREQEPTPAEPQPAATPASAPPAPVHPVTSSFVAIDFELGTSSKASPVQIGMARVIDGVVTDVHVGYVCPPEAVDEFGPWQQENLPFGPEVQFEAPTWEDTLKLITEWTTITGPDGSTRMLPLVAHNAASTERHVIAKTSAAAGLVPAEFTYACTMQVAKALDKGAGKYGLDVLAARYGVELSDHHDAGADATATAHLALYLLGVEGGREAFKASAAKIRAMGTVAE